MEYFVCVLFSLLMFSSWTRYIEASDNLNTSGHERNRRNMQHPAFGMMMGSPMAFPGNNMQSGFMSGSQPECITGDIVCPVWCLMEDEWGCKYCPCGPANGMSPPVVSNHKPAERKHEENNDCIGTILCMLSCKDGYKLGSRDREDGCQTCTCVKKNETKSSARYKLGSRDREDGCPNYTCVKKNETKSSQQQQQDCIGPACSAKNATGHMANESATNKSNNQSTSSCTWPLCMNGDGPNSGPGTGASMSSLPIGGVKDGGSIPGVDCIGPSCSAKNGMRMLGNAASVAQSSSSLHPPPTKATPRKPTTRKPQPGGLVKAPTKKTLLVMAPTKPSRRLYLVPIPTEPPKRHCATLEYCMNNCHHGFEVDNSKQECPNCKCILPMTPPPPTTTRKPDFIAIMRVCPDAVHCMKSCTLGYTLTSSHTEACPMCTCNREPKVLLLCERRLSCPNGCTVGYRGDQIGCPTCKCVAPSETTLRIEVQTTIIDSALTCNPKFSCVDKCSLGYRTGDNGCPTCVCLQPVTGHQSRPVMPHVPLPMMTQTNGLGCIGPECSAIHAVPNRLMLRCEQPLSCPYGCTVGYKCNREGCPICSCVAPSETTYKIQVQTIVVEKILNCAAKFSCPERCTFGFKTGGDGCPSCTCLQPVTVHQVHVVPETVSQLSLPAIVAPSGIGCLSPSCQPLQQMGQSGNIFQSATVQSQQMHQHGNHVPVVAHVARKPSAGKLVVQHTSIKKPAGVTSEQKLVVEKPIIEVPNTDGSSLTPDASKDFSAMEECPETVKCMVECQGTYDLTQRDGNICPDCKCTQDEMGCFGPSCSAPGAHNVIEEKSTPSPGECIAILHCVLTCDSGYDIGEYSSDGCPTCTCIE